MPINSFNDIDRMIASYKQSKIQRTKNFSTPASGYWMNSNETVSNVYETHYRSSSNSNSNMSRSTRTIGVGDVLDENGYFNSSRQLIK